MSDPKIRRFSGFQIAFHWLVAIPYMVLLLTGALLILRRLGLLDVVPQPMLSRIHRWVGIALIAFLVQLLIAGIVGGHIRAVLIDLALWVRFRARDLLWMSVLPLHILFPGRVRLPHVGRFNAGQKVHGLFIVAAISTFAATGILMLLRPADVRPWIVHSWLFFGAVAFLALHLFLGLINPPTRKALAGIFTGHVPLVYVQHHHPLTLDEPPHDAVPHAVVSFWAVLITGLLATGAAAGLFWHYGLHRSIARATGLARLDHPMISPGSLAAAHANDPRAANCTACHEGLNRPSDSACLVCHAPIRTVMQDHTGYHGQLTGHCRNCHADHRGPDADLRGLNTQTFNHQLARFTLQGQHRTLQCDQCHVGHSGTAGARRFIGLNFAACTDCHRAPHDDPKATDCTRCHTEQGWTGRNVVFDHQRGAGFALDGKHAEVACANCHGPARATATAAAAAGPLHAIKVMPAAGTTATLASSAFRILGVGRTCADCHVDPHNPSLGADCQRCHTTSGWTGRNLTFQHDRDTHFRLELAHAKASCEQCHKLPEAGAPLALATFKGISADCGSCHTDPHAGQLGAKCASCHTQTEWTGRQLLFAHNRDSKFVLKGQHAEAACAKCHKPPADSTKLALAKFTGIPTECKQCHDDPHRGQFEKNCTTCHNEQGWKGANLLFAHSRDSKFVLKGQHAEVACVKCHKPPADNTKLAMAKFAGTATECKQCHDDPHRGQFEKSCTACHNEQGWKGPRLLFDHNRDAQFKIDALHGGIACAACHKTTEQTIRFRPLAASCEQCHTPIADAMAGNISAIKFAEDPHKARVRCTDCHAPEVRAPAPAAFADACVKCHTARYRDLYFDWERSLNKRVAATQELVKSLRATDPKRAELLAERLTEPRRVGLHNINAAVKLLDELNGTTPAPVPVPAKHQP